MLHFTKNYIYYMVFEVLEPNFLKLKEKLVNGGVKTIDDVMNSHNDFLDECLKECFLTDQNLFRILTRLNQNSIFFARIIQRFFNQIGTNEIHERAIAENEYYDQYTKYMVDEEEEKSGAGRGADSLAMKRRRERLENKGKIYKNAFLENNYHTVVKKFQTTFDDIMRELLQVMTQGKRYETHIANLATRLDYNGFYTEQFNDIDVMIHPK